MADTDALDDILPRVHDLSDVELALLLCLIAHEHGILTTPNSSLDSLAREISLAATNTFGLTSSIIDCTPQTTLDQFASALLVAAPRTPASTNPSPRIDYFAHESHRSWLSSPPPPPPSSASIANCVIAKNLHLAPRLVQIQALELLRTRRILTRTSAYLAPKPFVFIPALEAASPGHCPRLTPHLTDFFALAHWHDPDEGFVNIEEANELEKRASTESVPVEDAPLIPEDVVDLLTELSHKVSVSVDVIRYQMNIVSFLRMHRAVRDGVSPAATRHFDKIMRCLAPLHRLDYVTPALVGIAAKKVYLHRIRITTPENERSMQWGSSIEAVTALLLGVGPQQVVDDVLGAVTAPT